MQHTLNLKLNYFKLGLHVVSDEMLLYFFQNLNYPIAQGALVHYGAMGMWLLFSWSL